MREVIKWSKDYRTGEVVTEKAYKPENLKGKATIHLRDKDGNIIQEVVSDNIIVPIGATTGHISGHALYETLYQSLMPSSNYPQGVQYSKSTPPGFGVIILSTDASMETEENLYRKGSVVGWCPRTDQNPGKDVTRGSYNPTESYVVYEDGYYHAHLVYDFGTSQGNGEFNSIWWTPAPYTTERSNITIPFRISRYSLAYRKHKIGLVYGGNKYKRNALGQICKVESNKYFPLLNTKAAVNGIETAQFSASEGTGGAGASSLWSYNNYKRRNSFTYNGFSSSDQTPAKIRAANFVIKDISNADETFVEKTVRIFDECPEIAECFENAFSKGRSYAYLDVFSLFTDENGIRWGYIYCATGSSSVKTFPKIDSDGNITPNASERSYFLFAYDTKNMAWKIKPGLTYTSLYIANANSTLINISSWDKKLLYDDIYLICAGSNTLYTFNTKEVTLDAWSYNSIYNEGDGTGNSTNCCCFGPYDLIITSNEDWGFRITRGYNAHTKLPNKVTKTSADTMKIQYDYYIQIPYAFTDDDNYIPPLD